MTQSDKVNLNSLSIVNDELVVAIEQAAARLEQFVAEPGKRELLEEFRESMAQINGTFRLIQLSGADLLSEAMLVVLDALQDEEGAIDEQCLSVLTNAFFVLPRYLEYTLQSRRGLPVLLIPTINELRQQSKMPALPESQFFSVDLNAGHYTPQAQASELLVEDLASLTRRLRHMYQIGLLNTLQGKQVRSALGVMQRAMERLEILAAGTPLATLWSVAAAALSVLRTNNMEMNKPRKMLLMALDREIKGFQAGGMEFLEREVPEKLLRQLLFILMLAHRPTERSREIIEAYGIEPLGFNDQDLCREQESLRGPSGNTVSSVAAVISDELRSVKEVLENISETKLVGFDEYESLSGGLGKIADILGVVGLASASASLKEQLPKIESWRDTADAWDAHEMVEVADALLFVESTLAGLETLNLSSDKLATVNSMARREVIASSQLAEAEMLVIQEAEGGLSLVKRALTAFAESNYDYGHIKNVSATLNGVRGAMTLLNLKKAAAVIESCSEFVERTLLSGQQPDALQQLLETFADAVIGLEYYLESIKYDRSADDEVLSIAEESLQALGYRVRTP